VENYLRDAGWIASTETVASIDRAGDGNMNLVLRVALEERSFILKQSRPWCEKYPHIPAPERRILVEAAFYRAVSGIPAVAAMMPRLMAVDEANRVVQLEDLGDGAGFTSLYDDGGSGLALLPELCRWLFALHSAEFPASVRERLANMDMRRLNHEYLYVLPLLTGNGLELDRITPGLQAAANRLKANKTYVRRIAELGDLYLRNGPRLLHGDYFPGSWLRHSTGVRIIDPEFCFFGPPEYDVGVFIGHLILARRPPVFARAVFEHYTPSFAFDRPLAWQYAGMEIMRRLIGVAQLPMSAPIAVKRQLLRLSEELVLEPKS
jgi:5-methylthioribose kinase